MMKTPEWILLGITFLFSYVSWASQETSSVVLAVTASSSFDTSLSTLKFASTDGERFKSAMTTVGLTNPKYFFLQNQSSTKEFRRMFMELARISDKNLRAKTFVFYFSGHSDERGLHLSDGLITKNELHSLLVKMPFESKVVFLDSCFSASLASKGFKPSKGFEIPAIAFDKPSGTVIVASSSKDSFSFESDDLRGGVFSYYLVEGLYGGVDFDQNGAVTIDELYQYIYGKTRFRSVNFPTAQQQIPEMVSDLQGKGALFLSFPSKATAALEMDSSIQGNVAISDVSGIRLFKFFKPESEKVNLRLSQGRYDIEVKSNQGQIGKGVIEIKETSRPILLTSSSLNWETIDKRTEQKVRSKGDEEGLSLGRIEVDTGVSTGVMPGDQRGPFVGVLYQQSLLRLGQLNFGFGLDILGSTHQGKLQNNLHTESVNSRTRSMQSQIGFMSELDISSIVSTSLFALLGKTYVIQTSEEEKVSYEKRSWYPSLGGRGQLAFKVSPNGRATLIYEFQRLTGVDSASQDTKYILHSNLGIGWALSF